MHLYIVNMAAESDRDLSMSSIQAIKPDEGKTIIFDSLPYIEKDRIHPDYEAYAINLIDQEMQALPMNPNLYPLLQEIPLFGNLKDSSISMVEYSELVQRGGKARPDPIDYNRIHVATEPIQSPPTSLSNEADVASWQTALNSAKIELEYQRNRLINLELQAEFESNLWKYHNTILDTHQSQPIQKTLEHQRNKVDRINAKRKYQQESQMGPKLQLLERKWGELIGTNQQLVTAIRMLEDEISSLRAAVGEGKDDLMDPSFHEEVAFMNNDDDDDLL